MSESTGTPASPASTPAPSAAPPATPADSGVSPPANESPSISISEAARLLNRQRRGPEVATPESTRRPPAAELAAAAKAAPPEAPKPSAGGAADGGLSAMERALGVPGAAAVAEGAPADMALGDGFEIEGQRLKTLAEVRAFAQRKSSDYTQKTQEIAQQRQALQAQQAALAQVLPFIQPELQRLAETMRDLPPLPDANLVETNPQQYMRERAAWETAVNEQNRLAGLTTLQQQARQRAMEQQVAAANEQLAKELPFWADPTERAAAQKQIVDWATTKGGFSQGELQGLTSPHHLKAMMKAAMFDRWVESAKTTAPTQIAPARGQAPPPAPSERVAVAEEAFGRKADYRTAAALLAARRASTNGAGR
jgi:hypothetical protein